MRTTRWMALPALALLVGLSALPASARTAVFGFPGTSQPVNVNVGFNSQVPLPDLEQETLASAQKSAREYLYRTSREECALLLETIAKSCRLTNLNINTQIQQHNPGQPFLYINGNATFTIGLSEDEPAATAQ